MPSIVAREDASTRRELPLASVAACRYRCRASVAAVRTARARRAIWRQPPVEARDRSSSVGAGRASDQGARPCATDEIAYRVQRGRHLDRLKPRAGVRTTRLWASRASDLTRHHVAVDHQPVWSDQLLRELATPLKTVPRLPACPTGRTRLDRRCHVTPTAPATRQTYAQRPFGRGLRRGIFDPFRPAFRRVPLSLPLQAGHRRMD